MTVVVMQSRVVLQEGALPGVPFTVPPKEECMAWVYLFVAGGFEIVWATGLKYSDGFTRLWPSVGTVAAMSVSMVCVMALACTSDLKSRLGRLMPSGPVLAPWVWLLWALSCSMSRAILPGCFLSF